MKIKRSELPRKIRPVFIEVEKKPVSVTHYGDTVAVILSKKTYDEWRKIIESIDKAN